MDFTDFYVMSADFGPKPVELDLLDPLSTNQQLAITHGQAAAPMPMKFKTLGGRVPTDAAKAFSSPFLHLYSKRFFEVLRVNGFTGWASYPISIESRKHPGMAHEYEGLIALGRCGPIDPSLSVHGTELASAPGGRAVPALFGLFFALDSWDGTDVFVPAETGMVVVTRRVKDALEQQRLTNLLFGRLDLEKEWGGSQRKHVGSWDS